VQHPALDFFRSPIGRTLAIVVGFFLFYLAGVSARQHAGISVVIRNESNQPVGDLGVRVDKSGNRHNLQRLAPGAHARVFVPATEQSRVVLEFTETGRHGLRTVNVFDHAQAGDCGTSTVRILPQRRTETVETHRSVCWSGWLDFL